MIFTQNSAGVFLLMFALAIANGKAFDFSQKDVAYYRRRFAVMLSTYICD
jgi:hypothetical protein